MKKIVVLSIILSVFYVAVNLSIAYAINVSYTINDIPNDAIDSPIFESYGINLINFTPGKDSGGIQIQFFTNYPQAGETLYSGPYSWATIPADLFITVTSAYLNINEPYAIPLVSHDGFNAGVLYFVESVKTSEDLDPSGNSGFYNYNHDIPVQISTGWELQGISDGLVTWNNLPTPGMPIFQIDFLSNFYASDESSTWSLTWGTATCAKDVVQGSVGVFAPLPGTVLFLGTGLGLLGLLGLRRGINGN